jgi:putative DNA primase/helicase
MSKEFNIVGMNYEMVDETSNAVIGKFTDFNIVKSLLGVNTGVFCEYPKGMLVIDIDDEITSAIAIEIIKTFSLKCYILKTTRGIHIYFKKPKDAKNLKKVGMLLATGLKCDFLGSNNLRERVVKGGVVRE